MARLSEAEAILWDVEEQMQYWEQHDEEFQ